MKQIKIDGKAYQIPTDWEEVTYYQFYKLQKINEPTKFKESIETLAILSGIPTEILYSAEPKLAEKVASIMPFVKEEIPKEEKEKILIQGKPHIFSGSVQSISLGQYVDIDYRLNQYENDTALALSYVIAIIYTPEGEAYNSTYAQRLQKEVLNLPITEVINLLSFFCPMERTTKRLQKFI